MASEVSRSAGPVVGIAVKTAVPPSAEICGSLTETIRGIAAMSSVSAGRSGGVDARSVQVDDHQQGTVEPGAEAVGEQVVGLSVRGLGRGVAGGREGGLHPQRGGRDREQGDDGAEQVGPRAARTPGARSATRRCPRRASAVRCRRITRPLSIRSPSRLSSAGSRVTAAATAKSTIRAVASPMEVRTPRPVRARDGRRDDDGPAGEDHGRARRAHRVRRGPGGCPGRRHGSPGSGPR